MRYDEEWFQKGEDALNVGNYDEAIRCYEKAVELDIDNARVYNNLGLAYYHKGLLD